MQKDVTIYDLLIIGSSDTEESFDCVNGQLKNLILGLEKSSER